MACALRTAQGKVMKSNWLSEKNPRLSTPVGDSPNERCVGVPSHRGVAPRIVRPPRPAYKSCRQSETNFENNMKACLPTQPNNAHLWEGDSFPPLRMCPAALDPDYREAVRRNIELQRRPIAIQSSPPRFQGWIIAGLLLLSLLSYYLVSRYVISSVVVQGRSMAPTLEDGERCFMDRWTLACRQPVRGDIVVVKDPGHNDYAVKRIVALPGEQVWIREGEVHVNGQKLEEPYLPLGIPTSANGETDQYFFVGKNHYFVLGDNRHNSEDSRTYGALGRQQILGLISK